MKKVLYITNIEVPYRVRVFNELSKHCDLTVLYERKKSDSRDNKWSVSEKSSYKKLYLEGCSVGSENSFSLKAIKYISGDYDRIIIGCYNSPIQMLLILLLRLFRKPYILNVDGEPFVGENGIKNRIKRFFIKGAEKYLVAGEISAKSIGKIVGNAEIIPYYFSSLSEKELEENGKKINERENYVLVVGQYLDVKGLDVALEAARMNESIHYKFIGMGEKTDSFIERFCPEIPANVEFIPFLQKSDLNIQYQKCAAFVLPSRQECWGLVINEAASFGTPIVSTWGSGAAFEFLSEAYPQYLSKPGDAESLYKCIADLLNTDSSDYSSYLLNKSRDYSIEKSVAAHTKVI